MTNYKVNDNFSLESLVGKIEVNVNATVNPVKRGRYEAIIAEIKAGKLTFDQANKKFLQA